MIRILAGRARALAPALIEGVGRALNERDASQIIVVPKQLTLHTEKLLIDGLNLRGSFRIQVLSAERLCHKIFDSAGWPKGEKIDERGRAMLVHASLRDADNGLTIYRGAWKKRGFAERAAHQLELFREAGLTSEDLAREAEKMPGVAGYKLADLSRVLDRYQEKVDGRFMDGETCFTSAAARVAKSDIPKNFDAWFYGFDITPPSLQKLIASMGAAMECVNVLMPLDTDLSAPDQEVFTPVRRALDRLKEACHMANCPFAVENLPEPPRAKQELTDLDRLLFAPTPGVRPDTVPASVQLAALRDPREEVLFAASLVRRLVMQRKWKWQDVVVLASDLEGSAKVLTDAFSACGIPLVLSDSRPASRHSLAEFLLTAVDLAARSFPQEDALAYLGTGYALPRDEADRLSNYIVQNGITGRNLLNEFTRGDDAEEIEPLREAAFAPLSRLRDGFREADTLSDELSALYRFLEETDAYKKSLELQRLLSDSGSRREAAELAQVWNRLMGTFDQLHALMGEKKLPMAELARSFRDALDATEIKSLPQSGDAVLAQPAGRITARPVKAVILIGMTDSPASDSSSLLTEPQRRTLAESTRAYLGPDPDENSLIRRFFIKSAFMMASDYVCVSYPLAGFDGRAQRPGSIFRYIRQVFPGLTLRGGMLGDERLDRMMQSTPPEALTRAAREMSKGSSAECLRERLSSVPAARPRLAQLARALDRQRAVESLSPETTQKLYRNMESLSVTRLETFAACPFAYFAGYGLSPDVVEPFDLTVQDEGNFFHSAVYRFSRAHMRDLGRMEPREAEEKMDRIADALLDELFRCAAAENPVTLARRRELASTARTAARTLAEHMLGSSFRTTNVELSFGGENDPATLSLDDGKCVLRGQIDRVDEWYRNEGGKYLRVIDYKRGGKSLDLSEAYYGTQLQLLIYLASAMNRRGGDSAGVYYFKLSDGILNTQSVDRGEIEKERRKDLSLKGLVPDDVELVSAMASDPNMIGAHIKSDGNAMDKRWAAASQEDFRRLTRHALACAREHYDRIRSGEAAVSPMGGEGGKCRYCKWKKACNFDATLDGDRVRENPHLKWNEVLTRLAEEDGEKKT